MFTGAVKQVVYSASAAVKQVIMAVWIEVSGSGSGVVKQVVVAAQL